MSITMVKKRLASGEACKKCLQAEELLRSRGLWDRIDHVVWANEGEPASEGMLLAAKLGIETAPFFLAGDRVYTSALAFIKAELSAPPPVVAGDAPSAEEIADARAKLEGAGPAEILRWGLTRFGADCAIAFSGAEDVALLDMAAKSGLPFSVFCLDTGRLHPETYRFLDRTRRHYGIEIQVVSPAHVAVEALVRKKGLFSFYDDGHEECCGARKVEPLKRTLTGYAAWATGQRRDQSPTRTDVAILDLDRGRTGKRGPLVKLNPLAGWSLAETWRYLRDNEVPTNELHERGYVSIGCEPCTRAVRPGEHERAGRWWWEEATKRECGLHIDK